MKTLALATLSALLVIGSISPAFAKTIAKTSESDIFVMPVGYGGAPTSLAFVKIQGQAAHDLYESMSTVAAGHKGSAKVELWSHGDQSSSFITSADGSAECGKLVDPTKTFFACRLWIQPLPESRK